MLAPSQYREHCGYRRRFDVSLRSFHRDLALVRQAGFYLETAAAGDYRMVCFMRDLDGA